MDDTSERRSKRQKRDSSYKSKAFEKFKQLKNKEINKYEIGEVENVYETIDEKEYVKTVLARNDDDWIVDDDGSGYVEDGRDIFDDDLDSESIAAASSSNKGKGVKRKKKGVSENATKGNLHYLLSNMPTKKKEEVKLDDDLALSAVLEEIDETTNSVAYEKFVRPVTGPLSKNGTSGRRIEHSTNITPNKVVILSDKKIVRNNVSSNGTPKIETIVKEIAETTNGLSNDTSHSKNIKFHIKKTENVIDTQPSTSSTSVNAKIIEDNSNLQQSNSSVQIDNQFDDDMDSYLDNIELDNLESQPETVEEDNLADYSNEFDYNWDGVDDKNLNDTMEAVEFEHEVANKNILCFYWWDAFEDVHKQPGVVFLFGKTYLEAEKSFVSCCVVVRNIERKLFFLPKIQEDESQHQITTQAIYNEISENVIKPLRILQFKSKPVTKKYAFNPEIPKESDYVEVRYSAKAPSISSSTTGKTFSKIFGTESSYLEIFLLERRIKGPCWLDISNAVQVANPLSWCKLEYDCLKVTDVNITQTNQTLAPPPLVVAAINMRCVLNPKTLNTEICMISCVSHKKYAVDKQPPNPPFQNHFCVMTRVEQYPLPFDFHAVLKNYKGTTVQKMDSERALLNYFINQFVKIDADLIVGHDLQGYQINILCDRLNHHKNNNFSKLGRVKRTTFIKQKLEKTLFVGRLVCDIKISARELIKSRSYDLDTLCKTVLKVTQRDDLEPEQIPKMYQSTKDIMKLVTLTMQDTSYIIKIMYLLNIIPLALQITNIAGNIMSKTLMGGRSERNEFLLLHAFHEKGYIVPDKQTRKFEEKPKSNSRKKPTYSGGLVLDPKPGFYDKFILLMDFNSLYPSIIQEYNICFTTIPLDLSEENMVLPDKSLALGILPTEIRKLVESRREVKKLMNSSDISNDLRMQYNIRQMALKLTANSMYGCLGFSNSRFYAKNLASLITHKGREILTNTRDLVQKNYYEVIYGDTDSIMINTNITDYDEVFQIGHKLKHEVNKLYKQVELDIDGVFKYLLLLKKKKYAAVTITKTKTGQLKTETEYKGIDIVRRDWSRLSCDAGYYILNEIFKDQPHDERINNVRTYLTKIKDDLKQNLIPVTSLVITKQLTKNPNLYADKKSLPHVQVALRYNQKFNGHYRAGDTVPYIICNDSSTKSATERAYHLEELKNSKELEIDVNYYLSQQVYPVITRICEPIEGMDSYQIADWLGLDTTSMNRPKINNSDLLCENITRPEVKFRNVEKFIFKCSACRCDNQVNDGELFLNKCSNSDCKIRPIDYLPKIQNQLTFAIVGFIDKYYMYELMCEDPTCTNEIVRLPLNFSGRFPICPSCGNSVLLKKYTEDDLHKQLLYFQHIFDLSKNPNKAFMDYRTETGYNSLKETVEYYLNRSAYSVVNLKEMFSVFGINESGEKQTKQTTIIEHFEEENDEDNEFD